MEQPGDPIHMSILIIDDDPDLLRMVGNFLRARGHRVHAARTGQDGLEVFRREPVDIVITDIRMPGLDGFEVMQAVHRLSPETEVIVVTAYGEIESAVRALREGAFDFFAKPVKMRELSASLRRTLRYQMLRRERDRAYERLDRFGKEAQRRYGLSALSGESPAIQKVRHQIRQVCETEATTVLICGETGTGKELVARAIHYEGTRSSGPFVAVDCSAIPEALVESELFGHVKGAFTDAREAHKGYFEQADGGTIFLDEIGDMKPAVQPKLLRTLEERCIHPVGGSAEIPIDTRVVSATNRDLQRAVSGDAFRKDLLYRLNVFTIHIPPLRERREDIAPLALHFLNRYVRELRKPIDGFSPEATALLEAHPFPGNVRELRNAIERAAIVCAGDQIVPSDLESLSVLDASSPFWMTSGQLEGASELDLNAIERNVIQEALRRSEGNLTSAAELLCISRDALRRRMARHDLS